MATVYGLRHKVSGFIYIGCTASNVNKRMREHRCILNAGKHSSGKLQDDWLRDGDECFELVILEKLPDDSNVVTKRARELYWMQVNSEKLYNAFQNSFSPTKEAREKGVKMRSANLKGSVQSPESNEKRRIAQLGKPKGHGAKISATKRRKSLEKSSL